MSFLKSVVAMYFVAVLGTASAAPPKDPSTQPGMEHVAIWALDIGKSARFLNETLGWRTHPIDFGVPEDNEVFGGMKLGFVDANGLWIELVQPTTAGPGMEFLKEKGNGAIVELDFFLQDFDRNFAQMKARGIDLIGMDGKPMKGNGLLQEYVVVDGKRIPADERLSYLPFDVARGTSIELAWEYPNGVVYLRDAQWSAQQATPKDGPRLDHVVVLAADLDATAKVYTDILRLPRISMQEGLSREWMGVDGRKHAWIKSNDHGFWIELVTPAANDAGKAALKKFGDGAIMELVVEVDDIAAFYERMQAKGITMTAGDAHPLPPGQKFIISKATGDRYNYFPLDRSEGMRILLYQRGPKHRSVYHRRDRG